MGPPWPPSHRPGGTLAPPGPRYRCIADELRRSHPVSRDSIGSAQMVKSCKDPAQHQQHHRDLVSTPSSPALAPTRTCPAAAAGGDGYQRSLGMQPASQQELRRHWEHWDSPPPAAHSPPAPSGDGSCHVQLKSIQGQRSPCLPGAGGCLGPAGPQHPAGCRSTIHDLPRDSVPAFHR